jgi:hypothetical protein
MYSGFPGRTNCQHAYEYDGSFETDGDDANPINVYGNDFTVTVVASTTGRYLLTFSEKFTKYASIGCWVTDASSGANYVLCIAQDPTAGTITLETQSTPGTEANLNGPRVSFRVVGLKS